MLLTLFLVVWREPNGRKENRTTPHLGSRDDAFRWLLGMKPYLFPDYVAEIAIRPWQTGDPR